MRYAWDQFEAYFGRPRLGPLAPLMRAVLGRLRRWDAATSSRPDRYVSISQYVAARIRRYYNRGSATVHPPVDTDFFQPSRASSEPFALIVSALVPYKQVDLAIDACRDARLPLVIAGDGPERARLEARADGQATFLGHVPDETVRDLYHRTKVVLLPGVEDFGLVPLEAQACGRPVVALAQGGAVETVIDGATGVLVSDATREGFAAALRGLERMSFDPAAIRAQAERFSRPAFLTAFSRQVDDLLAAPREAVRW
jgi:glycosyltransferase involved in cell wall biosynthesis